ncbi:BMP family lipoprotein [Parasporobacterium paucivorans]|uniref:Basic membrane protein A n=1 Tax=Parasporobacterium paucivorans DSM 15970 TaxID=1122934 RepID=A0A1M6L6K1_9FIRM|nr:BMP family ABC transporter substrate-binding protein [Parasporobacterium paucivorans]SHJ66797.1 basic membrane protein A [Parasporobacterium paucivorans DSM 15970]
MKKILALTLAILMVGGVILTGCGGSGTDETTGAAGTYEIALVTDVGNIDDQSFNQGAWEGVKKFAEDNNLTYAYYRPSEDSNEARIESIRSAVTKGAKTIVCPGYLFGEALAVVQDEYPEVKFIGIDVTTGDMVNANDETVAVGKNVALINYHEEQAGYLAGYAAVKEGYTKLGFLGGMAFPAVIRYGYGYILGADAAAKEMGITDQIQIKYWYCGGFAPTDDIQTKMAGWYTDGTEVVFACGGGIYLSAVAAAEAAGGKIIGVDVDQSAVSQTIITSAMKAITSSTVLVLTDLYAGKTTYLGKASNLGAAEDCVGLPTAEGSWRFTKFTKEEYQALFDKIKSGDLEISNESNPDVKPGVSIAVDYQS